MGVQGLGSLRFWSPAARHLGALTTQSAPERASESTASRDPASYREYEWPDWPSALDDAGSEIHDARVARQEGDRQIVIADSASALIGHEGKLDRSVLVFGSHCGRNTAEAVKAASPRGAIGHDAGIGLHAGGIQCISFGDEAGIPAATVGADSAYIGAGMSLWTTGTISVANETAKALGVRAGMSVQEAATIMLAATK
jgi:hypothetical protein